MTDMAYTVLKLVACGRSEGYTVDEMAKTSKYSSGSMFHLVKSLEELELVSVPTVDSPPLIVDVPHSAFCQTQGP